MNLGGGSCSCGPALYRKDQFNGWQCAVKRPQRTARDEMRVNNKSRCEMDKEESTRARRPRGTLRPRAYAARRVRVKALPCRLFFWLAKKLTRPSKKKGKEREV